MFFEMHDAIYIPAKGKRHALWTSAATCVWEAPAFYDQSFPLACLKSYQHNQRLKHLFNGILKIENTGYLDYIEQLKAQKTRPEKFLLLTDIYNHLVRSNLDTGSWKEIKYFPTLTNPDHDTMLIAFDTQ